MYPCDSVLTLLMSTGNHDCDPGDSLGFHIGYHGIPMGMAKNRGIPVGEFCKDGKAARPEGLKPFLVKVRGSVGGGAQPPAPV